MPDQALMKVLFCYCYGVSNVRITILCALVLLAGRPLALCALPESDSLSTRLARVAKNSNERVDLLNKIAAESWYYDLEQGLRLSQESYQLAVGNHYSQGIVMSLTGIGQYYYLKGDYESAIRFMRQALEQAGTANYGNYPAYTRICIGNLYRARSFFDSARICYEKEIKSLAGKSGVAFARAEAYRQLGILYSTWSYHGLAKQNLVTSLAISRNLKDSIRMAECWARLGMIVVRSLKFDSARYYLDSVIQVANRHENKFLLLQYYMYTGELSSSRSQYTKAIELQSKAFDLIEEGDYRQYYPAATQQLGSLFRITGDYSRSLENFLNAIKVAEKLGSRQEVAQITYNMGWLYFNQYEYSLATDFALKSKTLMEEINDKAGLSFPYNLLGNIYLQEKKYAKALENFAMALQLRKAIGLRYEMLSTSFSIAQVYSNLGQFKKSLDYYHAILKEAQSIDTRMTVMASNSLGRVYTSLKDYSQALYYLERAHSLCKEVPAGHLRENYKNFATFYKEQGNYQKATENYERYISLNDSIIRTEAVAKVAQMSALYQLEKKEEEIEDLHHSQQITQGKIKIQESRLRQQQNILISSIAGIVLLLGITYVLYLYYRSKHRSHERLENLNREVSEKNEEIQAQTEELIKANENLTRLNNELVESREEIQAQSEELTEANQMISDVNKHLEEKIRERSWQLQQAYTELDTFFYRSSHDFRRPLTTFLGLAEVAKITVKDTNALELFEKVKETAINLDKMLVKLQTISDVGAQQLVYKSISLRELVLNITDNFRGELEKRGIKLQYDIEVREEFYSYPVLLRVIIENLLENSIFFSSMENPYVKLHARQLNGSVIISVSDNGQGISAEFNDRIFDMYFRANHFSKGNGLGLYIVKKAVEKLHGMVTFESTQYVGSVFTVTIPSNHN